MMNIRYPSVVVYFCLPVILTVILSSCGPQYGMVYRYEVPNNDGRIYQCIFTCQDRKIDCERPITQRDFECKMEKRSAEMRCQMRNSGLPKSERTSCYFPYFCPEIDLQPCLIAYHSCYRKCGGIVDENFECIKNCEKEEEVTFSSTRDAPRTETKPPSQ